MDNSASNKSQTPCQSWMGPNDWSSMSAQNPFYTSPTRSQHRNLRSSSDQRPSCDQQQTSAQSCANNLSSFQSSLFKPFNNSSNLLSPSSLFANNVVPGSSHIVPFASRHTSSVLPTANQGKTLPSPSLPQPDHRLQPIALQHLQLASPHNSFQASFQASLTNQGVPNRLQDLSTSLPSCREQVSLTQV